MARDKDNVVGDYAAQVRAERARQDVAQGCEWFALCDHDAVGLAPHPVIGQVPICQRCADRFGITYAPLGGAQ